MDIISVNDDGAVVAFFTQELRLLANGIRQAADDPVHGDLFEAMHAMFQALFLAATLADEALRSDPLDWEEEDQEGEINRRTLVRREWEDNPVPPIPPTPAVQAHRDAEMRVAEAEGTAKHAEEARARARAAVDRMDQAQAATSAQEAT